MPSKDKNSSNVASTRTESEDVPFQRKPLFEYPALPKAEIACYWLVPILSLIYAYTRLYQASRAYVWDSNRAPWSEYEDHEWPFGLGKFRKDVTNEEWRYWSQYALYSLPWFFGHYILLNVFEKLFPTICTLNSPVWSKVLLSYWILAHCVLYGTTMTGVVLIQGFILYFMTWKLKSRILLWILAIVLLYPSMNNPTIIPSDGNEFWAITLLSYKVLHYLSYTLDMLADESKTKAKYSFLEMITFAFYLPYSISLIVLAKEARKQWSERSDRSVDWKWTLFFGLRMIFWYCFAELVTYFFYFEALMYDHEVMMILSKDTLVIVGMTVGQFFHLKYVVIFGFPAFFARLDRMQAREGPICISRLTTWSKIWRFFDRGLYVWFKEYIFLPLCRPTFSIWRKLSALFVTYSFVLLWHGATHDFFVWVVVSVCEIFVEQIGKGIYSMESVKKWRESHISDRNFRRILAWLHLVPFAFGLYSNFYFLGSSESGYVFVQRIFWQETVTVRWPFILLICLGYGQSNVCIEIDRLQSLKEKKVLEPTSEDQSKSGKRSKKE